MNDKWWQPQRVQVLVDVDLNGCMSVRRLSGASGIKDSLNISAAGEAISAEQQINESAFDCTRHLQSIHSRAYKIYVSQAHIEQTHRRVQILRRR